MKKIITLSVVLVLFTTLMTSCSTKNTFECSNCSTIVKKDDNYCSNCGKTLKSTDIQLPELPLTLTSYNKIFKDEVNGIIRINNIEHDPASSRLSFLGEIVLGEFNSVHWKLFDNNNYVIESGTLIFTNLKISEKFKKEVHLTKNLEANASYRLELSCE